MDVTPFESMLCLLWPRPDSSRAAWELMDIQLSGIAWLAVQGGVAGQDNAAVLDDATLLQNICRQRAKEAVDAAVFFSTTGDHP